MTDIDFTGRNVLVVGGSSGIGNAIAQAFRARGARVHVWGTRAVAGDYAGVEGSDLDGLGYSAVDVADAAAIYAAPAPFDRLDVLVLSQGTVRYNREEFAPEGWSAVMAVNLDSLMHCAQRFRGDLVESKGSIVMLSSIGGLRPTIGTPAYAASKAGAIHLVRTLAAAWGGKGVRVNCVAPGLVDTKLTKVTFDHDDRRDRALEKIALGRFASADEVATVTLFLASPMASFVTGQTIAVDGGASL